jgi:hypothetical protein
MASARSPDWNRTSMAEERLTCAVVASPLSLHLCSVPAPDTLESFLSPTSTSVPEHQELVYYENVTSSLERHAWLLHYSITR